MDYKLYLTAWIAFLVTLIALKLFGMFSGESDFDITLEGLGPDGKMMTAGILDGKYSSDSFHVKVKASPGPGVPLMALGSVTGNY
jgi:hypothetical protein